MSAAAWVSSAPCADQPREWFFPDGHDATALYAKGLAVCRSCPYTAECAAEHDRAQRQLQRPLPGLWGGVIHGRRLRPESVDCVTCGTTFEPKGTPAKYCSMACSSRAARKRRGLSEEGRTRLYPTSQSESLHSHDGCCHDAGGQVEDGMFGGRTPRERKVLLRHRGASDPQVTGASVTA